MKLKRGVRVLGLRPEIGIAMQIAESVAKKYGQELVVTSGMDGSHSNASLHYAGMAFDMRTWFWSGLEQQAVVKDLSLALGIDYDVILESNHIHVEYQPKEAY